GESFSGVSFFETEVTDSFMSCSIDRSARPGDTTAASTEAAAKTANAAPAAILRGRAQTARLGVGSVMAKVIRPRTETLLGGDFQDLLRFRNLCRGICESCRKQTSCR